MLKVIAKNYYTKEDYRFLEELLRNTYKEHILMCITCLKNCRKCPNKKACKDINQFIDYLHAINR